MDKKLEQKLYKKYPKIFSGRKKRGSLMAFGMACDDGWYWLIDRLCSAIQEYIDLNPRLPQLVAEQVKEKYGELRFYASYHSRTKGKSINMDDANHLSGMVHMAGALSYSICEVCGSFDAHPVNDGWIKTLCPEHEEKWKTGRRERIRKLGEDKHG